VASAVRLTAIGLLTATIGIGASGCDTVDQIHDAVYGDYHRLSPAGGGGVNLTIKRHATDAMAAGFHACKNGGNEDDATCGTAILRVARDQLNGQLRGRAREVWNGDYSVFGYHPNLGKGFRDAEGGDFAEAVGNLESRDNECLRVHWKPSGTNWTTTNDEGVAECSWGQRLQPG